MARDWAAAWERGDYASMHALLSDDARKRASLKRFVRTYREAGETVTLRKVATDNAARGGRRRLRPAGRRADAHLRPPARHGPPADGRAEGRHGRRSTGAHSSCSPACARARSSPARRRCPNRGDILARDGTPLAKGPDRLSDLGPLAAEVAGRVGPAPPERADELARRGVPEGAPVGLNGLEREFDERLAGSPGGILRAGTRVVARAKARDGVNVKSAIDPDIQRAAVEALAGRFGGIAVLRPSTGEVLGLSGIAFSAPQPPGSTFKIITLAAALEAGKVKPNASFPVQTETQLEGVKIQNAHGEACGGSLKNSFAASCNSVFAPLGAKVGAKRLVETAEKFGFNQVPGPLGAARSTIPAANEIGDDLAVGSSAIGQGKVLATPLELATVAATIGLRGRRVEPTLSRGAQGKETRAASERSARVIARFMRAVVTGGTGIGAAVPGVKVAGKTGTAELRSTVNEDPVPLEPGRRADRRSPRRTRPTPTPGSSASRPTRTRAWRSRCCWSARARAARPPRRRPRPSSRPR